MSYDPADLNLKRITDLKKRFKLPVCYGHHYNDSFPLFLSLFYKDVKKKSEKYFIIIYTSNMKLYNL